MNYQVNYFIYLYKMMSTPLVQGITNKQTNIVQGIIQSSKGKWVYQQISYINGGVTINYPLGCFNVAPTVRIGTVLQGLSYSSNIVICPIITSSTSTQVTVRVNINLGEIITEAGTNDIYINIFALE